jgi:cyd operon protein YbgT
LSGTALDRKQECVMWYFSWILGIGIALAFGVVNVMWLESREALRAAKRATR